MKHAIVLLALLQHPAYLNQPVISFDFIGQPVRTECQQVLEKPIGAGTYVAMVYVNKDQQYARAVAIALPVQANGEQYMTVAYPYSGTCPLITQILDQNGMPKIGS